MTAASSAGLSMRAGVNLRLPDQFDHSGGTLSHPLRI